jgi:hypothetical protein
VPLCLLVPSSSASLYGYFTPLVASLSSVKHTHKTVAMASLSLFTVTMVMWLLGASGASACQQRCVCDAQQLHASCSRASLDFLPIMLDPELRQLRAGHNRIRNLTELATLYPRLEMLELDHNHIERIESTQLAGLSQLRVSSLVYHFRSNHTHTHTSEHVLFVSFCGSFFVQRVVSVTCSLRPHTLTADRLHHHCSTPQLIGRERIRNATTLLLPLPPPPRLVIQKHSDPPSSFQ